MYYIIIITLMWFISGVFWVAGTNNKRQPPVPCPEVAITWSRAASPGHVLYIGTYTYYYAVRRRPRHTVRNDFKRIYYYFLFIQRYFLSTMNMVFYVLYHFYRYAWHLYGRLGLRVTTTPIRRGGCDNRITIVAGEDDETRNEKHNINKLYLRFVC